MKVKKLSEYGYAEAMLGLSLNKKQPVERMHMVANHLATKDGGHNKFTESIVVYFDVTAPLYWWKQFDTYRVGITKQSESTMHTLMNEPLSHSMFEEGIPLEWLSDLENLRRLGRFEELNNMLPQGFLQRRIICTNYKALRNIYQQRKRHKLVEWRFFCSTLLEELEFPSWLE